MLYLAWGWLRPGGLSAVYYVGEFAGVLSVTGSCGDARCRPR